MASVDSSKGETVSDVMRAAEIKSVHVQRAQWRKRHCMPRRAAVHQRPDQAALLLALRDGELLPLELGGRIVVFVRDDSLPSMPLWRAPDPPAPVSPRQFARRLMLFAVLLVIFTVHGVRNMLRRA